MIYKCEDNMNRHTTTYFRIDPNFPARLEHVFPPTSVTEVEKKPILVNTETHLRNHTRNIMRANTFCKICASKEKPTP